MKSGPGQGAKHPKLTLGKTRGRDGVMKSGLRNPNELDIRSSTIPRIEPERGE